MELTQKEMVMKHLKRKTLTSMEAFERYHITRLAAVIQRLKREGNKIRTIVNPQGRAHYAIYKLEK